MEHLIIKEVIMKTINAMRQRLNILLIVALAIMIYSCSSDDDGYSIGDIGVGYVTVQAEPENPFSLIFDRGFSGLPVASDQPWYKPVQGQRAFVIFNPLWDNYQGYDLALKINRIRDVLTKKVEILTAENESEFGDDPVRINKGDIWISNGYLTLIQTIKSPKKHKHRLSLVSNTLEEQAKDGFMHLEYRYNTYGDSIGVPAMADVSFYLKDFEGYEAAKGIKLRIKSAYNGDKELEIPFSKEGEKGPSEASLKKVDSGTFDGTTRVK